MENDFEVTLDINTLHLVLAVFAKVSEKSFLHFPLRDILDLNCWLATIPPPKLDGNGYRIPGQESTLSLEQLSLSMKELNMGIKCFNCTSPGLEAWNELLQKPGASEEFTNVTNGYIQDVIGLFGVTFLQDLIDGILVDAQKKCPHTDNKDPDAPAFKASVGPLPPPDTENVMAYLLAIVVPLFLGLFIWIAVRFIVHRRHKKWLQSLPSERVFLVQQKQEKEDHMEMELNELTTSMFKSDETPWFARYFVPFIVVVNIGFFLSGHLNLGGRALIDFYVAGETFRLDNFYEFSIAQSTLDLWVASGQGQVLSILILLCSGVWPYTKQLITLALWFLPPSVVSVSRRGQFLLWLDILAKWSMIDIFVLMLMICGFRIGGGTPNFDFLPPDFFYVNLVVVPMWGLYANLLAQIMSQVSSHYIVMYHRRIIRAGTIKYMTRHHPQEDKTEAQQQDPAELLIADLTAEERKEQLCKHEFIRIHKPERAKLVPRRVVNGMLPIIAILLSVLLVFCCILPSLRLETLGLLGLMMEFGYKFARQAVREESVFSKAMVLIDQAAYLDEVGHWIGNILLVIVFVGTILVVPIMMLFLLVWMWLWPQTRAQRERSAIILEILQAWQYVEVYMLGIIIECWQLGAVSILFVNRYCESFVGTIHMAAGYGFIADRDAQCFKLEASIMSGAYLLIPFAFGLSALGTLVVKAYVQQLRECQDVDDVISDEEKLRAFDRTTWDNRENALESIRKPPVHFTDTFRWILRKKDGSMVETSSESSSQVSGVEEMDKLLATSVETAPVAETSSSEDGGHDEKMTQHEREEYLRSMDC
jgi:Paraquat-inducible protein A